MKFRNRWLHMIRAVSILVFASLLLSPGLVLAGEEPTAEAEHLSLQKALEIAYKSNPDLRTAERQLDMAQYMRDELAKNMDFLPKAGGAPLYMYPAVQEAINSFQQAEINYRTARQGLDIVRNSLEAKVIAAYSGCLKAESNLQYYYKMLQYMEEQNRVNQTARNVGVVASTDYQKAVNGLEQYREAVRSQEVALQSQRAELARLLNKGDNWQPVLSSCPVIETWDRNPVNIEILRGVDESPLTLSQKHNLDIEKSKEFWPGTRTDAFMWEVQYDLAQLNYESASRQAAAQIEGTYHQADVLEKGIAIAKLEQEQAQRDLEVLELKHSVGLIPMYKLNPLEGSLAEARLQVEKCQMDLDNMQIDLVQLKAAYNVNTGHSAYDPRDWEVHG